MSAEDLPQRRIARRLRLSQGALLWERLWPAAWPTVAIAGSFVAAALFDLFGRLPPAAHALLLAAFAAALVIAVIVGWRSLGWPDEAAARRRVERNSGLEHRPLAALADQPGMPLDPASASLWEAHRRRMAAAARRLRVGWPAAGLARRDPWGLRAILAIVLLLAAIDAGGDWRDRLARAFAPGWVGAPPAAAASFDIWITPPDYTGLAPQFLRPDTAGPVRVPVGSTLLAQIHGGSSVPQLEVDDAQTAFATIDAHNFRAEATLAKGKVLSVSQGGTTLGRWPIEIVPDNPPVAAFAQPPEATAHAALRLEYRATDDYGVESVKVVIRRQSGDPQAKIEIPLPLPGLHLKEAQAASFQDLTPHPWAGLPVEITVVATDALGQTGTSEPVRMNLPERAFNNPVARAIIDQRKELVKDPGSREAVAEILEDLDARPALFHDDSVAYLALHLAALRLREADVDASIAAVVPLLWDTALRIEDGSMSLAERDLRRVQQELQDALARGAPDQEINRLMREMSEALDRYLQALAQDAQNRPGNETANPADPSRVLSERDLQRMLDRARELANSGARDQARQMLSQLQDMLENLRTARPGEMRPQGGSETEQMMRGLQDLMQRQQQLLDRSFRAQRRPGSQPNGPSGEPSDDVQPGDPQSAATQQEELRRALGEIMRHMGDGLGDIPDPLGRAERAMRGAAQALQRGQPGEAVAPQSEALDQLQQGARDLAKQLRERFGNRLGNPGGAEAPGEDVGEQGDRDPLGRPTSATGPFDQGDVAIPNASVLQKSREILDELRRRAGERQRPAIELDYIERLLRQF